ncbi:MAG: D-Ala-D-Ala carboxypeptidase family metallohydrolase [Firmicutes bacterium]|nr:D-Ala-D-Ala carboxypeptidase family metallohydrolase [Bacillota bacterium]
MSVKTYSKRIDGESQLSKNFKVKEMASKDGSDIILVDEELVSVLQKIRDWAQLSVSINSGYRTVTHNAKVGGSPTSKHIEGKAADIVVSGKTPLQVAQFAEALNIGGIGHAPSGQGNFCHIDTRPNKSRWEYYNGGKSQRVLQTFGGKTFKDQVQIATGIDNNTVAYLNTYQWATALWEKLAVSISQKGRKGATSDDIVKDGAKLEEATMSFLRAYKYGRELIDKLAKAMT